jgi:hypothetical protein
MSNVWLRPLFKTVRITSHFAHIEKNDGPSSVRLTASHSARATCAPDMAHKMWHGTILHSGRPNRIESRVELPPVLSTRSYRPRVPFAQPARAPPVEASSGSPLFCFLKYFGRKEVRIINLAQEEFDETYTAHKRVTPLLRTYCVSLCSGNGKIRSIREYISFYRSTGML